MLPRWLLRTSNTSTNNSPKPRASSSSLGDIGYGESIAFTALGDAVNVAARLQDMSKVLACEVVISEEVYQTAGLIDDELPRQKITVRGREAPIVVRTVVKAEKLATVIERLTAGSVAKA